MSRLIPGLLLTLIALGSVRPAASQTAPPRYQVIELPLVTGVKEAHATAINNAGQVVGETPAGSSKTYTGWLWTPATGSSAATIRALAALPGFPRSRADDINDVGQVVGQSYVPGGGVRATLWLATAPASPADFNTLRLDATVLPGWVLTRPMVLSNPDASGVYYVAGFGDYTDPVTSQVSSNQAVAWTMENGRIVRGAPLQHPYSTPAPTFWLLDMNNLGQIAGDYFDSTTGGPDSSYIWSAADGSLTAQIPLTSADTHAINDAGTVAGNNYDVPDAHRAYLCAAPYAAAQVKALRMPGTAGNTWGYGLNNWNQVVGQASYPSGVRSAVLWQPQADGTFQFYDLNNCKAGGAVGISLREAQGINDAAWIIGYHYTRNAQRAFVLTPIP